jgi:probable F420-dependent oxidoreductase
MEIGVVFPQTEYGSDPSAVKDYAQTAEALGYTHILAYDHILGANPDRPGGWKGPYTHLSSFLEPFVLFSFLAGVTTTIGFIPGVIILPQRQTAVVAKQAAVLDVLSGGRLRMGVGLGWNPVEYTALNENFHNRGRRIEEQVELMRRLWSEPLVTFSGQWHQVPDAGLNPMPVQQPIPVWFGGHARPALLRIARLADGWLPNYREPEDTRPALELLQGELERAGRSQADFGLEARLHFEDGDPDKWARVFQGWKSLGFTHLSFNTMGAGLRGPAEHLQAVSRFAEFIDIKNL